MEFQNLHLSTYDEQARSEKDIFEADNGSSAKNWERGRAEEKSDLAYNATLLTWETPSSCFLLRAHVAWVI